MSLQETFESLLNNDSPKLEGGEAYTVAGIGLGILVASAIAFGLVARRLLRPRGKDEGKLSADGAGSFQPYGQSLPIDNIQGLTHRPNSEAATLLVVAISCLLIFVGADSLAYMLFGLADDPPVETKQLAHFVSGSLKTVAGIALLGFFAAMKAPGMWRFSPQALGAKLLSVPLLWLLWLPMLFGSTMAAVGAMFIIDPIYEVQQQAVVEIIKYESTWQVPMAIVTAVIAAPLLEELFFRGAIQGLLAKSLPFTLNALIVGALFTFIHAPAGGTIHIIGPLLILSLALSWVTYVSKNVWPAVILHATHNGFVVVISVLMP